MKTAFVLLVAAVLVNAQGSRVQMAWWDSPLASSLDLSDGQTRQIRSTVADYRDKLRDLRSAVNQAESNLESIFNEDPVDQRKAGEAIEQLVNARSDLTRTLSQMDLKLRLVLTPEQWQTLRGQMGRGARGPRRRGPGPKGPVTGNGGAAAKATQ